jgi:NET1-associated nuclear protein 1 (U3 small nucleolar RNA-associated protein 17)
MYNGLRSGIAFDRNAGLVALPTENYCIQLYSLLDDRGISEVIIFFFLDEENVLLGRSKCPG